jgi:hypothetical protein
LVPEETQALAVRELVVEVPRSLGNASTTINRTVKVDDNTTTTRLTEGPTSHDNHNLNFEGCEFPEITR